MTQSERRHPIAIVGIGCRLPGETVSVRDHNRHDCTGQSSMPVPNYSQLRDTGVFSRFNAVWPLDEVKRL